jgi:peptide deformylase
MSDVISFDTKELAKVKPEQKATATKVTTLPTYKLVSENDPILKQELEEFDFTNPPIEPNLFASSLVETCIANRGLGLSANQCGFKHKVFVAGAGEEYVAYFNPKILAVSEEEEIGPEGCLSFPHLYFSIYRPKWVEVEYQDFTGEKKTARLEGLTARVVLHEYDHMNGITFHTRAKPMALKSGLDKRDKLFYKLNRAQKKLNKMGVK